MQRPLQDPDWRDSSQSVSSAVKAVQLAFHPYIGTSYCRGMPLPQIAQNPPFSCTRTTAPTRLNDTDLFSCESPPCSCACFDVQSFPAI